MTTDPDSTPMQTPWAMASTVAEHVGEKDLPMVPIGDGLGLQVLMVDLRNAVWVVRNRFAPGIIIPTHRHTGPVFAFTQSGKWFYNEYPDVVNTAGSFLYEPAGSVHTLHAADDAGEDTDAFFVIHGANLNLDADGNVESVVDAPIILTIYKALCEAAGFDEPDVLVKE